MTFWDRNKLKPNPQYDPATGLAKQPEHKAGCTVGYGWSPDSRLFGVSTTTPRMNVDNGIRLFRYNGVEVSNVPWDNANYKPDRLLETVFVPAPEGVYPDRPQSPAPKAPLADAAEVAQAKEKIAQAKPTIAPAAAGRYVPPSARGQNIGGGNSLAERMRREKEGSMRGSTKVVQKTTVAAPKGPSVIGLAPVETKSKNALKKEKQRVAKAKQAEEGAQEKAEEEAVAAAAAQDPQKRARKINKAMKKIEELKTKDPSTLNDDQKEKISSENSLREELAKLKI
jgi:translation initiation factor 2A